MKDGTTKKVIFFSLLLIINSSVYAQNYTRTNTTFEEMTVSEFIEFIKNSKLSEFVVLIEDFSFFIRDFKEIITNIIWFLIFFWIIRHLWWFFSVQKIKKDLMLIKENLAENNDRYRPLLLQSNLNNIEKIKKNKIIAIIIAFFLFLIVMRTCHYY